MNQIKADTIARTICLIIAIVNQILAVIGKDILPFGEDEIYQLCSLLATIITSIIAWWKNNSFTSIAIKHDAAMKEEKIAAKVAKG